MILRDGLHILDRLTICSFIFVNNLRVKGTRVQLTTENASVTAAAEDIQGVVFVVHGGAPPAFGAVAQLHHSRPFSLLNIEQHYIVQFD